MHSSCDLRALLPPLLLLAVAGAAADPSGALTEEEKSALVELHNFYRAQVSPPASDMLRMTWDNELAAFAQAYAQKCVWGHNKERGLRGENLFAIKDEGMDVPLAMENWYQERDHYNHSAATCDPGQMCGHYTQVVWSKTHKIGCGSHFCKTSQGLEETNIHLLVCNYEPPGNVKGKRPYLEGIPCSQCPLGYSCEKSLCEPTRGPEERQDSPQQATGVPSTPATEASRDTDAPSLATEGPRFSVTDMSGSLATEVPPAVETESPPLLTMEDLSSIAAEAPPTLATESPSTSSNHNLRSLDEETVSFSISTDIPAKSTDKDAHKISTSSTSPDSFPNPKMPLTETGEFRPESKEEVDTKAGLSPSSELLASVLPAQDEVSLDPRGHTPSKSLPSVPSTSAKANATGGHTLALQSSRSGAQSPEKPDWKLKSEGHVWGPFLRLLLPPLLLLAGIF